MSDTDAMRRFRVPDEADLPEDLRERIEAETERAGFTPNVCRALAYRPSHFRAFFACYDALVEDTELERGEVEMVVVAVSGVNDCRYCVVAHGALGRLYAEAPRLADQYSTHFGAGVRRCRCPERGRQQGSPRTTSDRAPSVHTSGHIVDRLTPVRLRFEPDGPRLVVTTSLAAPDLCHWSPYSIT
jgi:AhpD family alkylhydroperoxidase